MTSTFIDYGDAVSALVPVFGRSAAEAAVRAVSFTSKGPQSLRSVSGAVGVVRVTDGGGYAVDVPACMHGVPSPCGICGEFTL